MKFLLGISIVLFVANLSFAEKNHSDFSCEYSGNGVVTDLDGKELKDLNFVNKTTLFKLENNKYKAIQSRVFKNKTYGPFEFTFSIKKGVYLDVEKSPIGVCYKSGLCNTLFTSDLYSGVITSHFKKDQILMVVYGKIIGYSEPVVIIEKLVADKRITSFQ